MLPIVGVFVPSPRGRRFIEFLDVAPRLATTISKDQLNALGVGAIKIRRSRARPDGYLANGCVHCDAILGAFPLREDLTTFRAEGGRLSELGLATLLLPARWSRLRLPAVGEVGPRAGPP